MPNKRIVGVEVIFDAKDSYYYIKAKIGSVWYNVSLAYPYAFLNDALYFASKILGQEATLKDNQLEV